MADRPCPVKQIRNRYQDRTICTAPSLISLSALFLLVFRLNTNSVFDFINILLILQIHDHCRKMELLYCPSISALAPKITNNPSNIRGFLRNQWNFTNLRQNLSNSGGNSNFLAVVTSASTDGGLEGGATDTAVVVEKPPSELRRFEVFGGSPMPLGATGRDGGVNFAIASGNATSATLCLITLDSLLEVKLVGSGRCFCLIWQPLAIIFIIHDVSCIQVFFYFFPVQDCLKIMALIFPFYLRSSYQVIFFLRIGNKRSTFFLKVTKKSGKRIRTLPRCYHPKSC